MTRPVNTQNLIRQYPLAEKFIRRMEKIDENYGRHRHQQLFVARLHRLQELKPCQADHEHQAGCYPRDLVERVSAEQTRER